GPDEIDPATGLSRSTVVRPLRDAPPTTDSRPAAALAPRAARAHIALILPTASPSLGRLADAVRQGFLAAAQAAGKEALPVQVTALENEATSLIAACRSAQASGALVVVAGLTRDGANTLAGSDCARQPALALNEVAPARSDISQKLF